MSIALRALTDRCGWAICYATLFLLSSGAIALHDWRKCVAAEVVTDPVPLELEEIPSSGPYCGIYSLAACLNAAGVKVDVDRMWNPVYIGSRQGSTAAELIRAATDFGAYATAYHHLTHHELERSRHPLLLHTRSNRVGPTFDHWVAFLGYEGGRIRILDAPNKVQTYSPAEVLALWDGLAIAVSKEPMDESLLQGAWADSAVFFTAIGLVLSLIAVTWERFGRDKPPVGRLRFRRSLFKETTVVLGVCLLMALAFHGISEIGFFANPSAVAEVTRRFHSVNGIPELSLQELEQTARLPNAVLLDARYSVDFKAGALPDAISFPINSTLADRREVLSAFNRSSIFVVYCQSEHCAFADRVAQFLAFNGYKNLYIYRGGYREWSHLRHPVKVGQRQLDL